VTIASFGQETEQVFRITTTKGEVIKASNYRVNEKRKVTYIQTLEGKSFSLKSSKIASIRKLVEGWNYFDFNANGFTDYSVVEVDSLKKEEIYKLVVEWVKVTYNTPDKVIKSQIENKSIRIEGYSDVLASHNALFPTYYGTKYSILISIRDGKYKFDPKWAQYTIPAGTYNKELTFNAFNDNDESIVKSKFNKKEEVKTLYKKMPSDFETFYNDLNMSLYEYIKKETTKPKEGSDDDW
jgi:hypothetical protein